MSEQQPNIDTQTLSPLTPNTSYSSSRNLPSQDAFMLEMKLWVCRVITKRSIQKKPPTHVEQGGHVVGQGLQYNLISSPPFFSLYYPPTPSASQSHPFSSPLKHQMTHFPTRAVFSMMHDANLDPRLHFLSHTFGTHMEFNMMMFAKY